MIFYAYIRYMGNSSVLRYRIIKISGEGIIEKHLEVRKLLGQ